MDHFDIHCRLRGVLGDIVRTLINISPTNIYRWCFIVCVCVLSRYAEISIGAMHYCIKGKPKTDFLAQYTSYICITMNVSILINAYIAKYLGLLLSSGVFTILMTVFKYLLTLQCNFPVYLDYISIRKLWCIFLCLVLTFLKYFLSIFYLPIFYNAVIGVI